MFIPQIPEEIVDAYIENHGTINGSSHRWKLLQSTSNDFFDGKLVANVALTHNNLCTNRLDFVDKFFDLGPVATAPRYENEVPGTTHGHPVSHASTETTSAANDDVACISSEEFIGLPAINLCEKVSG